MPCDLSNASADLDQQLLDLTVQDQHDSGSDSAEGVGSGALEKSGGTLVLHDLGEAVHGALVQPLVLRLLGLHLQASADGVERVRSVTGSDGGGLGDGELGGKADDALLLSPGVDAGKGVVHTEVHTSVRDDTHHGDTEAVVKASNTRGALGGLDEAVSKAVEGLLLATDIGSKSGTSIVKRVHNGQRTGTGKTTGSHVGQEEQTELLLRVVSGEQVLESILESEVERLGREVTDHVGEVTSPEGAQALLLVHAGEAVANASVASNLTRLDHGVSILGLDDKLHSLDRSSGGLGNSTGHTTGSEIGSETLQEGGHLLLLLDFSHFRCL